MVPCHRFVTLNLPVISKVGYGKQQSYLKSNGLVGHNDMSNHTVSQLDTADNQGRGVEEPTDQTADLARAHVGGSSSDARDQQEHEGEQDEIDSDADDADDSDPVPSSNDQDNTDEDDTDDSDPALPLLSSSDDDRTSSSRNESSTGDGQEWMEISTVRHLKAFSVLLFSCEIN